MGSLVLFGWVSAREANAAPGEDGASRPEDREMKGTLGVGAIHTIAGLNGINVRYFPIERLAIGLNLGVAMFSYREPAGDSGPCPGDDCELDEGRTVAALATGLEVLYFIYRGRPAGTLPFRADFALGGRFGVIHVTNATDVDNNLDDPTELHVEIPAIIHLMFGDHFALAPEFGIDFRIVPRSRDRDSNPGTGRAETISGDAVNGPGFGFDITDETGIFVGASMHYYF